MNDPIEKIHAFWDELADFHSSAADAAVMHMLEGLCALFNAQNACWSVLVRLPTAAPGDALNGWRPRFWRFLHPLKKLVESTSKRLDEISDEKLPAEVDVSYVVAVAGDEPFLVRHIRESLPPDWFEGEHYRRNYLDVGLADQLSARIRVNEDVMIYILIYRDPVSPRFGAGEKEAFAMAVRGMKWFHRQQLLSHGLLIAEAPVTPAERLVLLALLGGKSEAQIAASLKQSHNTTHAHIKSIYRKFGVTNRPALTALWLGKLS